MFWFRRPPYLRWIAAGGLVVAAVLMDLNDAAGGLHPFAARDLTKGEAVSDDAVEWRRVPAGLLDAPDLADAVAARDLAAGEPILQGSLRSGPEIPPGWWAVPLAVPASAVPGSAVRLVVLAPPLVVDGVVVRSGEAGAFGMPEAGLVAIPGADAVVVATAAARGELTILLEP